MSKVVSFRLSDSEWEGLKEEANSIPCSPGENVKYWYLHREKALDDMVDFGYEQCKRDFGIVSPD